MHTVNRLNTSNFLFFSVDRQHAIINRCRKHLNTTLALSLFPSDNADWLIVDGEPSYQEKKELHIWKYQPNSWKKKSTVWTRAVCLLCAYVFALTTTPEFWIQTNANSELKICSVLCERNLNFNSTKLLPPLENLHSQTYNLNSTKQNEAKKI